MTSNIQKFNSSWINTEPYRNGNLREVVIYFWEDGELANPDYTGRIFPKDKIEGLAQKMAKGRKIPYIPPGTPLIAFEYSNGKYEAYLIPSEGKVSSISGKQFSSFKYCALHASIVANTLGISILMDNRIFDPIEYQSKKV